MPTNRESADGSITLRILQVKQPDLTFGLLALTRLVVMTWPSLPPLLVVLLLGDLSLRDSVFAGAFARRSGRIWILAAVICVRKAMSQWKRQLTRSSLCSTYLSSRPVVGVAVSRQVVPGCVDSKIEAEAEN